MKLIFGAFTAVLLIAHAPLPLQAQAEPGISNAVPHLVKFSGTLFAGDGQPLHGIVGVTFALYEEDRGGRPLWMETQNVEADTAGHYTVTLGVTRNEGITGGIFSSGQGRWLGVQPEGEPERPRVLMTSVPYALKAGDADTLGGLPASAFIKAAAPAVAHGEIVSNGNTKASDSTTSVVPDVTGTGATGRLALWTTSANLGSSVLFQSSAKRIGIGTTGPLAQLDVYSTTATGVSGSSNIFNGVGGQSYSSTGSGVWGGNSATSGVAYGVYGQSLSSSGIAVNGNATALAGNTIGVNGFAASPNGYGVYGANVATSGPAVGVNGQTASPNGAAVSGLNTAVTGGSGGSFTSNATSGFGLGVNAITASPDGYAVYGVNTGAIGGVAVRGESNATSGWSAGLSGQSTSTQGVGVFGNATSTSGATNGVQGSSASPNGNGVSGSNSATTGFAVGVTGFSASPAGAGVNGFSSAPSGGIGVIGATDISGTAVQGINQTCGNSGCTPVAGIAGLFDTGAGGTILLGLGGNHNGVFSVDANGNGFFAGNLNVTGKLTKGSGSFKIDHPLDPANKYLSHSFVESPDMMDVYNGLIRLNQKGEAWVELPDYFQALNGDYRYQLTPIGGPAPRLYVASEVSQNRFKIAGGRPGGKVSWQITGVRRDPYANAHRIPVSEDKPAAEQGHYLHPDVYGATAVPAPTGSLE
ncbi:MAG: hypothetical protein U0Q18_25715 [Bryobacteraceae bacterium]